LSSLRTAAASTRSVRVGSTRHVSTRRAAHATSAQATSAHTSRQCTSRQRTPRQCTTRQRTPRHEACGQRQGFASQRTHAMRGRAESITARRAARRACFFVGGAPAGYESSTPSLCEAQAAHAASQQIGKDPDIYIHGARRKQHHRQAPVIARQAAYGTSLRCAVGTCCRAWGV